MKLLELIDIAYRRGCNSSLAAAEQTDRFAQLCRELDHEAAHVEYLGECLIAAAEQCLPQALLDLADTWVDRPAQSQLIILELVYQTLRSNAWQPDRPPQPRQPRPRAAEVLPAEHGAWETGAYRPCCLGLGTMLMAWAKRAGASHYFAQVLRTNTGAILEAQLTLAEQMRTQLNEQTPTAAAHPNTRQAVSGWISDILHDLAAIAAYEFHPQLVIELADGQWVALDPYLLNRDVLDPKLWPIAQANQLMATAERNRVVLMRSHGATDGFAEHFSQGLAQATDMVKMLRLGVDLGLIGESLPAAASVIMSTIEFNPRLQPFCGWSLVQLTAHGLFPPDYTGEISDEACSAADERFGRDPQYRQQALERMISGIFIMWLGSLRREGRRLIARTAHPAIELAHPGNAVAVGVLNNLRCGLGPKPRHLGGALFRHSRSQAIWHDTRMELRGRRHLPPELRQSLASYEARLATISEEGRHPLVHRLLENSPPGGTSSDRTQA